MTLVAVSMLVFGGLLILSAWENQSLVQTTRDILAGDYQPHQTPAPSVSNAGPLNPGVNPGTSFL